ncbi:MAG: class I SAM-dependent methyltransferase [Verrucomicrobiota bacterium]|nr:class I SAM-dependent methyltransferase [Verrucomicrobiota bacterium]
MKETFQASDEACKALLHIAPEHCLRKTLKDCFSVYHTADLMQPNVDFQEDLQDLSFKDASYDVVLISRVLNIPPKLNACLHEIRRILKPGGMALIAETYTREQTLDFKPMKKGRSREIGVDFMKTLETVFDRVEFHTSDRFDPSFQLSNRMTFNGAPSDDYPPCVRIPGLGFNEIVAICHRDA